MLSITKFYQYDIPCKLGEGLYVSERNAAWVDIESNVVFCSDGKSFSSYLLANKPTVIYGFNDHEIYLETDVGFITFDREKELEVNSVSSSSCPYKLSGSGYRSNDGDDCGEHRLLGFMHQNSPKRHTGYIYNISGNQYSLLDNDISIPNTFVPLSANEILVSDSLTGEIWLFELDNYGQLKSKTLWAMIDSIGSPDGGCKVGDFILIALWDASEIAVFTRDGKPVQRLPMPVLRPTHCKFDHLSSQLWVTSAATGLTPDQLAEYPDSGKTMIFNLRTS